MLSSSGDNLGTSLEGKWPVFVFEGDEEGEDDEVADSPELIDSEPNLLTDERANGDDVACRRQERD